jgi:hypothetical protein
LVRLVLIANPRSCTAPDPSELEALLAGGGAEVGYVRSTRSATSDLEEACALARDPGAATAPAELGRAAGRPFVNAASAGLAVVAAHAAKPHKPRLGPLA